MSGIFQGDILIKMAIELGLEDFKKNPWLVDHMLSDLVDIPYLKDKYGQKQIDACKEWIKTTPINIVLRGRDDKDEFPLVSIELGTSPEKEDMKHMADQSAETMLLLPEQIGKPIPYVVKPVQNFTYDNGSGLLTFDTTPVGYSKVAPGQVVVDPATGNGYIIQDVVIQEGIQLEAGLNITAASLGILPKNRLYAARVEHTFFQETYNVGCHAHGDPQTMLWLWSIVKYSILRYRESLLEANGFAQSSITSGPPDKEGAWTTPGGEKAWSRYISLNGQVENSWVKSPRRFIEAVNLQESATSFKGGIKILSNSEPDDEETEKSESWYPIKDES